MASGWEKRVWCCATFGEILLIGENLSGKAAKGCMSMYWRMKMHTDNPQLIKDRRYFMKTYPSCFVGSETLDWLLSTNQIPNREMGVIIMNILRDNNILHHVADSYHFKDDSSFYRFRKDDSTYPWVEDLAIFLRGQRMFQKLYQDKTSSVMKTQEQNGKKYKQCFQGNHLVDWLVNNSEVVTRDEGVEEGRIFLQNEVIRHITDAQHFKDADLLYQFKIDYSRKLGLMDLVIPPEQSDSDEDTVDGKLSSVKSKVSSALKKTRKSSIKDKPDSRSSSPSCAKDIPGKDKERPTRSESGYHSDLHDSPSSPPTTFQESPENDSPEQPTLKRVSSLQIDSPTGVLIRKATIDELLTENSPFVKRQVRVAQDPVGYGFVIRGESPVYVKTVDPMGPAAKAGLRVGHFIYSVNDEQVLDMDHRELAHIVVNSNGYMNMVVMEHIHDQR